jgi:NhaP-type Na+/H+ or K+/H+ antiporter
MYAELAVLALFIFAYSMAAGRVERAAASGPIVFVFAGFIMGPMVLGWYEEDATSTRLRILADLTLATILFIDAANSNLGILKKHYHLPGRMLLLGLPGVILLGTGVALVLFDQLTLVEAAILGTMLAATDAALGKAVISHPSVPAHIREGLNIESGLNDGMCVPILLLLIALAVGSNEGGGTSGAILLVAKELGIGLLVGLVLVYLGGKLWTWCDEQGWVTDIWKQVTTVALALSCFTVAHSLHGSGYIAAFTGGLLFGYMAKDSTHELVHTAEGIGETLALMTWMLFGSTVIGQSFEEFTWEMLIYALLSLTVLRMLPIVLSLAGTGEPLKTKFFLGWFGPRGLASIVFAIIVIDAEVPQAKFLAMVVVLTVFFSLIAHGVSANPLAERMAKK